MSSENQDLIIRDIIADVYTERLRQKDLSIGGDTDQFDKTNSQSDWVAYITAYAGRASEKVFRNGAQNESFRNNMVKVAALAVAAIEAYDKEYC